MKMSIPVFFMLVFTWENPMHLAKFLLLSALLAMGVNQLAFGQSKDSLPEGALASVNGRPIPELSVDNVERQLKASGQETDREKILEELINLEILTQAAESINLDKQAEVSANLQLQYTQTMANAYLAKVGADMTFSEDDLKAEYDSQSANVDRAEYRGSHILLESSKQAKDMIAKLTAGAKFEDLAKEHSVDPAGDNGGDLGWFQSSTMPPEFSEAIALMSVGDVSKTPVKSEYGYHIIKLVDKREAALPDFDSVKSGLTNLAVRRALADHVEALKLAADIKQR